MEEEEYNSEDDIQMEEVTDDGSDLEEGEDGDEYVIEEGDEFYDEDGNLIESGVGEDAGPPPPDDSVFLLDEHHSEPVYAVACGHTNTNLVASGGGDDCSLLWTNSTPPVALGTWQDSVVAVSFSSTDEWLALGSMDGTIRAYHLKRQNREVLLEGCSGEIEWLVWHPHHPVLLAGSQDCTIWMWNLGEHYSNPDKILLGVFIGHSDSVSCGLFTPNGRRFVSASLDGEMKLWDPNVQSAPLHTFHGTHVFHEGPIVSLALQQQASGGVLVATGGGTDGMVCLSKLDVKKVVAKLNHGQSDEPVSIECLAFLDNNNHASFHVLCSGGSDGKVVVWDLSVQARRSVLTHSEGNVIVRMLSLPSSDYLVTACADGVVRKWDVRASKLLTSLTGHQDAILDMALTSDATSVVTASEDGTCRVFVVA